MILDTYTRDHIIAAARWIIDSKAKVGLMLRGNLGNGKTTLLRALIKFIAFVTETEFGYSNRKQVKFYTAKNIALLCGDEQGRMAYRKLFDEELLAIDELGEEPAEIISYGMVYEPLKDLLLERYARRKFTIVTTNLPSKKIAEKYSERISDRFREMMEIINFTNKSYRK